MTNEQLHWWQKFWQAILKPGGEPLAAEPGLPLPMLDYHDAAPHALQQPDPYKSDLESASDTFEGFHDRADAGGIRGWAWDSRRPNDAIEVDIYDGNISLATVPADQYREDLQALGKGNGAHGFAYPIPARLADGQAHTIRVMIARTQIELTHTPKTLICTEPISAYEGFHERADCAWISGWVWDSTRPDAAVAVDIFDRDVLLATLMAESFREDLLNADKGNGKHSFSLATPSQLKDGRPHTIRVTIAGTNIELGQTAIEIVCQEAIERL